jgi:predicted MFS family arabinose efflux permease
MGRVTATASPAAPAPPRGGARVAVAVTVLTLATFAAVTAETLPVGLLPVIARDLGTSETRVGLLVSAYAVVVAAASLPLTALLGRWSRRRALTALLLAYAVGNAVFAGTGDYWVALAARLLAGLAHAGFFSVALGAAVSLVPPERAGRVTAWVFTGVTLAFTAGVPAGTALGTAVGWRWAFAGIAAVLLTLAGLAAALLPAAPPPAAAEPAPLRQVLRRRPVVLVAVVSVVVTLGHYTAFTYVSPILRAAGIGEGSVSLVLFGYGAAGALGLLLAGVLADRFPRAALAGVIALVAAPLGVIGVLGAAAAPTVVATVVWGVAFGALPALLQTAARRAAPDAGDAMPGLSNATTNAGIAGGGVIGGRELLGADPSVLALTGAGLAVLALVLVLAGSARRAPARGAATTPPTGYTPRDPARRRIQ